MIKNSKIYIAGHNGLVGSAIKRQLEAEGYKNLIYKDQSKLDLLDENQTADFFNSEKPEYVFLAAAKVGGIIANRDHPAEFIYENLKIELNVVHQAYKFQAKKLLFLGSTCVYPKMAPQPIKEEYLLTGPLEPTNEAYAIAKIAGIKLCQHYNQQYKTNFICAMPTNLYGPNDNFDPVSSHVLPALIRKFHEAKEENKKSVTIWGTGTPTREFLYIDDLAKALVFLMSEYDSSEIINVGSGEEVSIMDLAKTIAKVVGYKGEIATDTSKPDGTPRKFTDTSRLSSLGWKPKINLEKGLKRTYEWYLDNVK